MKIYDHSEFGILVRMQRFLTLLKQTDPHVHAQFERQKLKPEFYAFRWLTLLLSQEFRLPDVIRLWDSLFADQERNFEFLLYICCAMIVYVDDDLMMAKECFWSVLLVFSELDFSMAPNHRISNYSKFVQRRRTNDRPGKKSHSSGNTHRNSKDWLVTGGSDREDPTEETDKCTGPSDVQGFCLTLELSTRYGCLPDPGEGGGIETGASLVRCFSLRTSQQDPRNSASSGCCLRCRDVSVSILCFSPGSDRSESIVASLSLSLFFFLSSRSKLSFYSQYLSFTLQPRAFLRYSIKIYHSYWLVSATHVRTYFSLFLYVYYLFFFSCEKDVRIKMNPEFRFRRSPF